LAVAETKTLVRWFVGCSRDEDVGSLVRWL